MLDPPPPSELCKIHIFPSFLCSFSWEIVSVSPCIGWSFQPVIPRNTSHGVDRPEKINHISVNGIVTRKIHCQLDD